MESGSPETFPSILRGFREHPKGSPADGERFSNSRLELFYTEVESGSPESTSAKPRGFRERPKAWLSPRQASPAQGSPFITSRLGIKLEGWNRADLELTGADALEGSWSE